MRPITITFILGITAAICSGLAAFYYPWPVPELTNERVNQPIFAAFDSKQVRSMEVVQFSEQRQTLERVLLERKGEKWTLPNYDSFPASNISRIASVISLLGDCRVLQLESDQQTDHLKYQVLDPDDPEAASNTSGIGRKVTLKDRNQKVLGALIVGAALSTQDGELKRLVRIPGEPQVYVVDFDSSILDTQFAAWVDPNILQVQTTQNGPGNPFASLLINNYRIQPDKITDATTEWNYRANLTLKESALSISALEKPEGETWSAIATTDQTLPVMQTAVSNLPKLTYFNIRAKGSALVAALKNLQNVTAAEPFQALKELGFKQTAGVNQPAEFVGSGGDLVVTFSNGLRVQIILGNVAASAQGDSKLSRWVMFVASVANDVLAKPEPPQTPEGQELTEDQQRIYTRSLEQWQERVKTAEQTAAGFNQLHGAWYYAVDEDVIAALRPVLPTSN